MADAYDVTLVQGETTLQHMLAQGAGKKQWDLEVTPPLPPAILMGEASVENIQPEQEFRLGQQDWRRGLQDLMYNDPYKYFRTQTVDGRNKGIAVLSPKELSALTLPTGSIDRVVSNPGFERVDKTDDTKAEGWLGGTRTDVWPPHSGSYCLRVTSTDTLAYQDVPFSDDDKGKTFTLKVWCDNGQLKITIDDGVGSSTQTYSGSSWTQVSVQRTLSASATRLRIKLQYNGDNGQFDDITLTRAATNYGTCGPQEHFAGYRVVASGSSLVKINASGISKVADFAHTVTKLHEYKGNLYIALGWNNRYWYTSDLALFLESTQSCGQEGKRSPLTADVDLTTTSWVVANGSVFGSTPFYARCDDEVVKVTGITTNTLTVERAQKGTTAGAHTAGTDVIEQATTSGAKHFSVVKGYQFWISDGPNSVRDTDDPSNDGLPFSTSYTLPNPYYEITGLVDDEEVVYVRKEDQAYYLSGENVYPLVPELASEASTTKHYGIVKHQGKLYLPSGENSLYEYDAGVVTVLSPRRYAPGDSELDGQILAVAGGPEWLYIAIANGTDVEILAGRRDEIEGQTAWWWHTVWHKALDGVTSMGVSNIEGSRRLYVGTSTPGDGIVRWIEEGFYEGNYQAGSSGVFITPWFRSNFPSDEKHWKSVQVVAKCKSETGKETSIQVEYQKKGDTNWTSLGSCTQQAGTGYPPEKTDEFNIGVNSERIRFKFTLSTNHADYSPVLYGTGGGYGASGFVQFDKRRLFKPTLLVAAKWRERNGAVKTRTPSTDLGNLWSMMDTKDTLTLTDWLSRQWTVRPYREAYQEGHRYDESGRIDQWLVTLQLIEV